jgi:hypothetical protein
MMLRVLTEPVRMLSSRSGCALQTGGVAADAGGDLAWAWLNIGAAAMGATIVQRLEADLMELDFKSSARCRGRSPRLRECRPYAVVRRRPSKFASVRRRPWRQRMTANDGEFVGTFKRWAIRGGSACAWTGLLPANGFPKRLRIRRLARCRPKPESQLPPTMAPLSPTQSLCQFAGISCHRRTGPAGVGDLGCPVAAK